jgi:D-cysteine desulfhydrase family pyridoxal phosphate-dependent enzyme
MLTNKLEKVKLAHLPTPLEPMPRLSAALGGVTLWIKRDDQTGLAGGGNKTRKLEFLAAAARAAGADTLITGGAPQSNHCRQTAAAATVLGLRCVLVLAGEPEPATGNILLDQLLGAELVWAGRAPRDDVMQTTFSRQRAAGRVPYLIPYGGSNAVGAAAYVAAIDELVQQTQAQSLPLFDRIVFASSSGGTHAGLAVGAAGLGLPTQVLGISIDKPLVELTGDTVATLATETASLLGLNSSFGAADIHANADYLGGGYGVMAQPEAEAISLFARTEGLLLDPVYTARAAAGLIDLIRRGEIDRRERVLFWHTGGLPALFAPRYTAQLAQATSAADRTP